MAASACDEDSEEVRSCLCVRTFALVYKTFFPMVLCGHVQLHKYNYLLSESNLHTIQQGPTPRLHLTSSTYTPVP